MFCIIVIGLARSGKDTVADFIAENYGFRKFVFSDIIAEELRKQGKEVTKANMAELGNEMRNEGQGVLAERILEKIGESTKIVLVGARSPEEIETVKEKLKNVVVVRVEAEEEKRFSRKGQVDLQNREGFFARDSIDKEKKGFGKALEMAEFKLENNANITELHGKTRALMRTFKY